MRDNDGLRSELVQLAAVCVAMVEQIDYGAAHVEALVGDPDSKGGDLGHGMQQGHAVLLDVHEERIHQADKCHAGAWCRWGEPRTHTADVWLAILVEEAGEVAEAMLEGGQLRTHTVGRDIAPRLARVGQKARSYLEHRYG